MRTILLTLAVSAALATPAHAQRMTLDYAGAAWGLIGVGGARLEINLDDNSYSASGTVRSGGIAALFLRTRIEARSGGAIDHEGDVRWRRYWLDHMYDGVHRYVTMRPTEASVHADISPTYPDGWGEPPATDQQKAAARDPLSSLIAMAADVGDTRVCRGDYLTFDGRWLYRLEVRGGEQQAIERGPYIGPALRCRVSYIPVAGFTPQDQGYRDPPPPGSIWFALLEGERFAPPVRAAMPLPLGTATLTLRSWEIEASAL
ncbi:MAG: DUF3108 domain-containing protein [Hyphomonadaceae bacterium]